MNDSQTQTPIFKSQIKQIFDHSTPKQSNMRKQQLFPNTEPSQRFQIFFQDTGIQLDEKEKISPYRFIPLIKHKQVNTTPFHAYSIYKKKLVNQQILDEQYDRVTKKHLTDNLPFSDQDVGQKNQYSVDTNRPKATKLLNKSKQQHRISQSNDDSTGLIYNEEYYQKRQLTDKEQSVISYPLNNSGGQLRNLIDEHKTKEHYYTDQTMPLHLQSNKISQRRSKVSPNFPINQSLVLKEIKDLKKTGRQDVIFNLQNAEIYQTVKIRNLSTRFGGNHKLIKPNMHDIRSITTSLYYKNRNQFPRQDHVRKTQFFRQSSK